MKNKNLLKQIILVFSLMVGAIMLFSSLPTGFAASLVQGDERIVGEETDLRTMILNIVNYALGFLGLVAVIMIIYGGVLYVTSAGNEEQVNKGKNILKWVIIGLVIILLSFVIVNAVLGAAGTAT